MSPKLSVSDILGRSQEAVGAHAKYARMLWELEATDSDSCYKELTRCIGFLFTVPLVSQDIPIDYFRSVEFLQHYFAH